MSYDFPNTSGKVVLITNYGDIIIELFSKECPLACRNFIQLCLEEYYNDMAFNRILKDFLIQIGDDSETTYGSNFKDEFHSRLKYKTKGMVGCVNNNKQNSNNNQFFITLIPCPWLDNVNTIFGRIVENSIYTLLNITSVPVDSNGFCILESESVPKIIKVNIVNNPFNDIKIRKKETKTYKLEDKLLIKDQELIQKTLKKLNNKNLLSFDDEQDTIKIDNNIVTNNYTNLTNVRLNDIKNNNPNSIKEEKESKNESIENSSKNIDSKKYKSRKFNYGCESDKCENNKGEVNENNKDCNITNITINNKVTNFNNVNETDENLLHLNENFNSNSNLSKLEKYKQKFMTSKDVDSKLTLKLNKNLNSSKCYKTLEELKSKLNKTDNVEKEIITKNKDINNESNNLINKNSWLNHKLKFHIDSEKAYFLDKVNHENDKYDYYI